MLFLFNNYSLDSERRELRHNSELRSVEPQVFDVLECLLRHRDAVVSKDKLLSIVWNGRVVSDATIASRVNAARAAIGDNGDDQRLIRTALRKGFRFVGDVREQQDPAAAEAPKQYPALPAKPSIAVLSFENMSGDPEQQYFADGMAEEIVTALSRCVWLFVIARNSSFTYKGKNVEVRQIGRELGVRYVLEGSVRRAGERLRITGQLIDATSGAHIWADRFEGELSDVFRLQDFITASVVAAIEPTLQRAEIDRLKHKPAENLNSYDLLLRAQQHASEFTEASMAEALHCLQEALVLDPTYASAMSLAAYCYAERGIQGWMKHPQAELAEGLRLAAQSVEIGKDDGNVLWMAAHAIRQLAMDARRANDLVYRSLELNPNSAMAMTVAGWNEVGLGAAAKGMELLRRAERLSPRDPRGWFITTGLSFAQFMQDQFEESASLARKALLHNPRFATAHRVLAGSLAKLGRMEEAAAVVRELLKIHPDLTVSGWRARTQFLEDSVSIKFGDAMRLAGLPG